MLKKRKNRNRDDPETACTLLLTVPTDPHTYTNTYTDTNTQTNTLLSSNTSVIVHFPSLANSGTGPISEFEG